MWIFGQVWFACLAGFMVGVILAWLLWVRPLVRRVAELRRQLASVGSWSASQQPGAVRDDQFRSYQLSPTGLVERPSGPPAPGVSFAGHQQEQPPMNTGYVGAPAADAGRAYTTDEYGFPDLLAHGGATGEPPRSASPSWPVETGAGAGAAGFTDTDRSDQDYLDYLRSGNVPTDTQPDEDDALLLDSGELPPHHEPASSYVDQTTSVLPADMINGLGSGVIGGESSNFEPTDYFRPTEHEAPSSSQYGSIEDAESFETDPGRTERLNPPQQSTGTWPSSRSAELTRDDEPDHIERDEVEPQQIRPTHIAPGSGSSDITQMLQPVGALDLGADLRADNQQLPTSDEPEPSDSTASAPEPAPADAAPAEDSPIKDKLGGADPTPTPVDESDSPIRSLFEPVIDPEHATDYTPSQPIRPSAPPLRVRTGVGQAAPEQPPLRAPAGAAGWHVGPFGPGSALPLPDGSAPSPQFRVKARSSSMVFHTESSPFYDRLEPQVWFRSPEDAQRAGFTPWERRTQG